MSWLISFEVGCLFLIAILVGVFVASALGIILRAGLDKLPKWVAPVSVVLLLICGLTFMFHYIIYGGL